jgi:hypothetical protein
MKESGKRRAKNEECPPRSFPSCKQTTFLHLQKEENSPRQDSLTRNPKSNHTVPPSEQLE